MRINVCDDNNTYLSVNFHFCKSVSFFLLLLLCVARYEPDSGIELLKFIDDNDDDGSEYEGPLPTSPKQIKCVKLLDVETDGRKGDVRLYSARDRGESMKREIMHKCVT